MGGSIHTSFVALEHRSYKSTYDQRKFRFLTNKQLPIHDRRTPDKKDCKVSTRIPFPKQTRFYSNLAAELFIYSRGSWDKIIILTYIFPQNKGRKPMVSNSFTRRFSLYKCYLRFSLYKCYTRLSNQFPGI